VQQELQYYPDRIRNLNVWADDAASQVNGFSKFLSGQKSLRLDGEHVAAARSDLMLKLEILSGALWVMNWENYCDGEDAPTDERAAELQTEAGEAEANLEATIAATLNSLGTLQSAIMEDIGVARAKLHALSEKLIARGE